MEQFSICSGDSIWEDDDRNTFTEVTNNQHSVGNDQHHTKSNTSEYIPNIYPQPYLIEYYDQFGVSNKCNGSPLENGSVMSHSAANHSNFLHNNVPMEQCFQISSTTQSWNIYNNISYNHNNLITSPTISTTLPPAAPQSLTTKGKLLSKVKYKNNIMEKYLRDCKPSIIEPTTITESNQNYYSSSGSDNEPTGSIQSDILRPGEITQVMGGIELSKWLESTANFTPNKNNYIEWDYATRFDNIIFHLYSPHKQNMFFRFSAIRQIRKKIITQTVHQPKQFLTTSAKTWKRLRCLPVWQETTGRVCSALVESLLTNLS